MTRRPPKPEPGREGGGARTIALGEEPLGLEGVRDLARGDARPWLSSGTRSGMQATAEVLLEHLEEGERVYGVTTGVGASVDTDVAGSRSRELSVNILRMHGCGTGRILDEEESAAVVAVRLASLARGYSGVRPLVADRLADLLAHRILPCIPEEGSVGASGDLTPLSYVAAALTGEREVLHEGRVRPAAEAMAEVGLEPVRLAEKEALALMNGTSVSTALGCLAWARAHRLARLGAAVTAMASEAIGGNPTHFDETLHALKPHPGQRTVARWIREDLGPAPRPGRAPTRLQDRYSIRCAPHVLGVLLDALDWTRGLLETEIESVDDNPVVDPERRRPLHGGNFYGGHVGFALDTLKPAVAHVADLLDRQLMLLCNPAENGGLPVNLVGASDEEAALHHGFKAVGIATSSIAAEALKQTAPAGAFSRSTELHNQDKVPMATTAARDALRVVELVERVAAMATLATCQAVDLCDGAALGPGSRAIHEAVREVVPPLEGDRRMDRDVEAVLSLLHGDELPLDETEPG